MSYFEFNGHRSDEFNIRIQKKSVYSVPKRDLSLTAIPGRNGELISSNNRFGNASVSYTCFVPAKSIDELSDRITLIKNWLYRDVDSYHDLKDSYDLRFKRKAVFNNKLDISDEVNKIGTFTITFSCKPQRYLLDGLNTITITETTTLINPFSLTSSPYLRIFGNGDGRVIIQNSKGNRIINISSINEYIEIDSEEMNCYKGTLLQNNLVSSDGFPEFVEGNNIISFEGDITRIEIVPRWVSL